MNFTQLLFSASRLEPFFESDLAQQAEALALRRDMITLLTFVRDNKVVGTQSTGNMPLKKIHELTGSFVDPPALESKIGDRVYKIRSETEVWQLYFLHILAEAGKLLKSAPARRWQLTPAGKKILNVPPLIQVWSLLMTWWHRVNWLVAYPFEGMGENLPAYFNIFTLDSLNNIPVNTRISFEEFADALIEKTGLTWTASESKFARMLLHGSIERMVINILATFGMVEQEYREEPLGKGTTSKLAAFKITQLGKVLLEAMTIAQVDWI